MFRSATIDWSGSASRAAHHIWLAEVERGRSREEVTGRVIAEARRDPDVIVGLAFRVPDRLG